VQLPIPEIGMFPAIRDLDQRIEDNGAETIVFMTWGRRDGLPSAGFPDYAAMQSQVKEKLPDNCRRVGFIGCPRGNRLAKHTGRTPQNRSLQPGWQPPQPGRILSGRQRVLHPDHG
jgi:hypothetical protein